MTRSPTRGLRRVLRWGAVAAAWLGLAAGARAADLTVRAGDGRVLESLPVERLEDDSDELFVAANDLVRVLQLERFWKPETRKLVLKTGDRGITLTVDARLVLDGDDEVLLRVPVRYRQGSVMLPLEFLERVLVPGLGGGTRFDRRTLELRTGSLLSDVAGIEYEVEGDVTRIRVHLSQPFRYRAQSTSPATVRLQLRGARIDPVALAADQPTPLVSSVQAEQDGEDASVFFQLTGNLDRLQDRSLDGGRTVLLSLQRAAQQRPPRRDFQLPAPATPPAASESLRVLVLDAGHGGFDQGVHASGLVEKDVTLQIVRQLQPVLQRDLGMRVVLVRDDDQTLAAEHRAEIANLAHGDILISIHCNGWFGSTASGFEAAFVPSPGAGSGTVAATLDFQPWKEAQRPYCERSRALAEALQAELGRTLSIPNRGAKAAALELLRGVLMPAVQLDVGFLTNASEAELLTTPDFAATLAAGISAAVQRYRAEFEPPPAAPSGANP